MVTAFARDELAHQAQVRGVRLEAILTKPATPSSLLDAIGAAFGRVVAAPAVTADTPPVSSNRPLAGKRVLLVEDNEINQELACELLREAGMDVVIASNGQQALDILVRDDRFDGILMDCQMPVMDGYTATQAMRQNPAWAHLPIIAMTANAMDGEREKVLAIGMNDHIAKPIDVEQMYATLAQWLGAGGDNTRP